MPALCCRTAAAAAKLQHMLLAATLAAVSADVAFVSDVPCDPKDETRKRKRLTGLDSKTFFQVSLEL